MYMLVCVCVCLMCIKACDVGIYMLLGITDIIN